MKECYLCGEKAVSWDADIDADQIDADKEGIFHYYHCKKCGAKISVFETFKTEGSEHETDQH